MTSVDQLRQAVALGASRSAPEWLSGIWIREGAAEVESATAVGLVRSSPHSRETAGRRSHDVGSEGIWEGPIADVGEQGMLLTCTPLAGRYCLRHHFASQLLFLLFLNVCI